MSNARSPQGRFAAVIVLTVASFAPLMHVLGLAGLVTACEPSREPPPAGEEFTPMGCSQGKILDFDGGCQCPKGTVEAATGWCIAGSATTLDVRSSPAADGSGEAPEALPAGNDGRAAGDAGGATGCPLLRHEPPIVCEDRASFAAGEMFYGEGDDAMKLTVVAFELDCDPVTNGEFVSFLQVNGNDAGKDHTHYLCDGCYDWDCTDPSVNKHPEFAAIDCGPGGYTVKSSCQADPAGPKTASCAEHPVTSATWLGAEAYCEWKGGRLPSQAEWEYAATPQRGCAFPWGDAAPSAQLANCGEALCKDGFDGTSPVGEFAAGGGAGGVRDLVGNVAEWTADCFSDSSYPWSHRYETYGPSSIDPPEFSCFGDQRTIRGSGYDFQSAIMLDAYVSNPMEEWRGAPSIGFRCAF